MSIFNVFNIGSGHTSNEPDQTISVLASQCIYTGTTGWVLNDGVLSMGGAYAGQYTERLDATVNAILNTGNRRILHSKGGATEVHCPTALSAGDTVNLTGHSRGAVMCHLLANRLANHMAGLGHSITINMIVLDPVNMTQKYATESGTLNRNGCRMLGEYRVIAMTNEGSSFFPLKILALEDATHVGKIKPLTMPGTHGTGTKCQSTRVGQACLEMIRFYMAKWTTGFTKPVLNNDQFCDLFAAVHDEVLDKKHPGGVMVLGKSQKFDSARAQKVASITNDPAWQAARSGLPKPKRAFGTYFPDSYFINRFHENRFLKQYLDTDIYKSYPRCNATVQSSISRYIEYTRAGLAR